MSIGKRIANRQTKPKRIIEVSEWGEDNKPLKIYVSDITGGDIDKIQRKHKDFLNNATIAAMVDLIILKSEDADGNRIFSLEDKYTLLGEPVNLIADVSTQIFNNIETIEDQEKN